MAARPTLMPISIRPVWRARCSGSCGSLTYVGTAELRRPVADDRPFVVALCGEVAQLASVDLSDQAACSGAHSLECNGS